MGQKMSRDQFIDFMARIDKSSSYITKQCFEDQGETFDASHFFSEQNETLSSFEDMYDYDLPNENDANIWIEHKK